MLQGAPLDVVRSIRGEGFAISISETGFAEYAARASRQNERNAFENRIRSLVPVVDALAPLMPTRKRFFDRFDEAAVGRAHSARAELKGAWDATVKGLDDTQWSEFTSKADAWFDEHAVGLKDLAKRWEPGEDIDHFDRLKPAQRLAHIREYLHTAIPGEHVLSGSYRERADLFFRVFALFLWRTAKGAWSPSKNDMQDLEQAVHVGEPAFLLTEDGRLLDRVEESGSRQRFWVLRPREFLEGPLPCGEPWGTRAVKRSRRQTGRRLSSRCASAQRGKRGVHVEG